MQIHDLQPEHENKSKKRVGRGGRRGKTSGRGHKGQKARAGGTPRPQIRDRIKKLPKLRGYQFKSIQEKPQVVNVGSLQEVVNEDDIISPSYLVEAGLVDEKGGKLPRVKILGDGEITTAVTIEGCEISASAQEKIESAGGTVSHG